MAAKSVQNNKKQPKPEQKKRSGATKKLAAADLDYVRIEEHPDLEPVAGEEGLFQYKPDGNNYRIYRDDSEVYKKGNDDVNSNEERNNPANQGEAKQTLPEKDKDDFSGARQKMMDEMFELASKLPDGEIERSIATLTKKVENWPDHFPKEAPELYTDRKASENFPDFMLRVYEPTGCLDGTFTTAHLEILDKSAAAGAHTYLRTHKKFPDNLTLPASRTRKSKKSVVEKKM